ncbi:MAG: hypothetical protein EB068_04660, partial [Betaproteobacteria bacterium]|nr:hypothetical protein [Betaproteobacteria bacterium]
MTDSHELIVENTTFDEIVEGQSFSLSRTLSQDDIQAFAAVSLGSHALLSAENVRFGNLQRNCLL